MKFTNINKTNMRSVEAETAKDAAEIFAQVLARKAYGKKGTVRCLNVETCDEDNNVLCVVATIGDGVNYSSEYIYPRAVK